MEININHSMHGKFVPTEKKAAELSKLMPWRRIAVLAPNKKIKFYQDGKLVEEQEFLNAGENR